MKLKTIIVLLLFSAGAFIVLKSVSKTSTDTCKDLLLENIEALAKDENETNTLICIGNGSVDCPQEGKNSEQVKYLGLRDNVSLY